MDKNYFLFLFCFFQCMVSTSQSAKFLEAKALFDKGYNEGDYSGWKKADSIFNFLIEKNTLPKEKLLAQTYHIKINIKKDHEKHLNTLNSLIDQYHKQHINDKELLDDLTLLKQKKRCYLKEPGAEEAIKKIIEDQLKSPDPNNFILALAYDFLGRGYFDIKKFDLSAQYGRKSISYYKKANKQDLYVLSLQATGAAYYNADKIDSSLYLMKTAYKEMKSRKALNHNRLSGLAFNVGIINQGKTGEIIEAEDFLKEAIFHEINANGEESPTLITYYSLLADNFYIIKDIEQAEFFANKGYHLAHEVLKTESVYLKSLASMALSKIYISKKQFDKARSLMDIVLEESIAFFGEEDKFTSQAYIDRAAIEVGAQNYKEAEKYLLKSVAASKAINRVYSMEASYTKLYEMYLQSGEYSKALHYAKLNKASQDQNLIKDYKSKAFAELYVAQSYIGLKALDSATHIKQKLQQRLASYENVSDLEIQLLALENEILLESYKQNKTKPDLDKAFGNVAKLIKQIISSKKSYNYQESKIFYSKSIVPYINTALEICYIKYTQSKNPKVLNSIFKLIEINKSSILLDGITDFKLKIKEGVPESVMEAEVLSKKRLQTLSENIYKAKNDTTVSSIALNALYDQQLKLNNKVDSIQNYLKENHSDYYKSKNLLEAQSLRFYQENILKKNQCIVEYYLNENNLYRLVITAKNISFKKLSNAKSIAVDVEKLLTSLQKMEDIADLRKKIGRTLLPNFSKEISEIIFISDGILSKLPFEILDYNNSYLLNEFYISYAGSLQLYHEQTEIHKKEKINLKWMGFAPVYEDRSLASNREEVTAIASLTKGKYSVGSNATKQNFLNTSKNVSILHLATHTELDKTNPMLNKMIFYNNGSDPFELTAAEIYAMDLQSNLAVLSSCETGGGNYENDGVMSMSRAFAYAGIPSTVMSLWKVPDAQTADIMIYFYENLEAGQQKNEALRNAKLTYLENTKLPELKHPYYWAGFVVSGDISPIKNEISSWWYIAVGTVLLILILILVKRKNHSNRDNKSLDSAA